MQQKYNEICDKISKIIKKGLGSEHVYNDKYLKTKIKSYKEKVNANFHSNKVPKEDFQCTSISIILNNSVFGTGKNYYPKVFRRISIRCQRNEDA